MARIRTRFSSDKALAIVTTSRMTDSSTSYISPYDEIYPLPQKFVKVLSEFRVGRTLSPASVLAMLTAKSFETFLHQPRGHEEGRHRVGPPPARYGVGHQPQQERQREIRAGQRFLRLRPERGTADGLSRMELSPGDQRHDDERGSSQDDADRTLRHGVLVPEGPAGLDQHVESQCQERAADKAVNPPLASLNGLRVPSPHIDTE